MMPSFFLSFCGRGKKLNHFKEEVSCLPKMRPPLVAPNGTRTGAVALKNSGSLITYEVNLKK
jgi:hypothetical protein